MGERVRCDHCGEIMYVDDLICIEGIHSAPMYMCTEDEYKCPYCGSYDIDWDPHEEDEDGEEDEDE